MAVMPNMGGFKGGGYGMGTNNGQRGETGGILNYPDCGSCPNSSGSGGRGIGNYCLPGNSYWQQPNCTVPPINPVVCLAEGSTVHMADGQLQKIQDLKVGDYLAGIDGDGKQAPQKVRSIGKFESECVAVEFDSGTVTCSSSHVFIAVGVKEISVSELVPGSQVIGIDGEAHTVASIKPIGLKAVFALEVVPNHMFFAEGLAHHNKFACAVPFTFD